MLNGRSALSRHKLSLSECSLVVALPVKWWLLLLTVASGMLVLYLR